MILKVHKCLTFSCLLLGASDLSDRGRGQGPGLDSTPGTRATNWQREVADINGSY